MDIFKELSPEDIFLFYFICFVNPYLRKFFPIVFRESGTELGKEREIDRNRERDIDLRKTH